MNVIETVNQLKDQLSEVFNIYKNLTHPEVLKVSQRLDFALNELELQKVNGEVSKVGQSF